MKSTVGSNTDTRTFLVSFCNQSHGKAAFGVLSTSDDSLRVVSTGIQYRESGLQQATGLASYDGAVYAVVSIARTAHILQIAPDLTIIAKYPLRKIRRPHSLVATGVNEFHAVSTGTECVVRICISPDRREVLAEEVVWKPNQDESSADLYHLNGLALVGSDLVVSGFGLGWRQTLERRREGHSALYDGFLFNVTTGEMLANGLQMPHSPLPVQGGIAFCESAAESVTVPGVGVSTALQGYTRGLSVINNQILVGVSQARQNHPGSQLSPTAVLALDKSDLSVVATIELGAHAREIYDLLPVDWPMNCKKSSEEFGVQPASQ